MVRRRNSELGGCSDPTCGPTLAVTNPWSGISLQGKCANRFRLRSGASRTATLLSISLLAACAGQTPEPKIITHEVKVEITVPCMKSDLNLSPVFPDSDAALRASPGAGDMMQLLAAGRLLRIQTMKEWAAALTACR